MSHSYGFGNLVMPLLLQARRYDEESLSRISCSSISRISISRLRGWAYMFNYRPRMLQPPGGRPSAMLISQARAGCEDDTDFRERFGIKVPVLRSE